MVQMRTVALVLSLLASGVLAQSEVEELDLSGWVGLGIQNSPSLVQADADVLSAEAGVRSAGSFLWPSLSFRGSGGHSWNSIPDVSGGYTDVDNSSWSMSMNLSQELLGSGGGSWLLLSGSRHSRTAAGLDYRGTELDLVLSIVEGYYGVIEAEQTLASSRRALDRSREQAARTASLYRLGGATNLEMIQSEVQLSRDSLTVLQRRQGLDAAYASLRQSAGVVGSEMVVDTSAVLQPVTIETALGYELDLSANPSLAASSERLAGSGITLEAARRNYWPSLSAGAGWAWSNDEPDLGDLAERDSWNVSLSLNWMLFDGFSRESMIQSSRASLLRQEASLESLENSLATSAIVSRDVLVNAIAAWELAGLVTDQVGEQLRYTEMSYSLGGTSLLDLLQAREDFAEAEASEVSAMTSCLVAEARLLILLGRMPRLGE
jgi:outer membrane protein TolC